MANIEISEELARVVAEARQRFSEFRAKKLELDQDALDLLFYAVSAMETPSRFSTASPGWILTKLASWHRLGSQLVSDPEAISGFLPATGHSYALQNQTMS